MLTRDVEYQMKLRGVVPEKQRIIQILEDVYKQAASEQDFYSRLEAQNLMLYSRRGTVIGIKATRKFRFKTLGYGEDVLRKLNKDLTKNKRLDIIKRIREKQQSKWHSKGYERNRGI